MQHPPDLHGRLRERGRARDREADAASAARRKDAAQVGALTAALRTGQHTFPNVLGSLNVERAVALLVADPLCGSSEED